MSGRRAGFTLIELLVAIGIFIGLMLIGSMAFVSLSRAGERSQAALAISAKSTAFNRYLDDHLACAPGYTPLWLETGADGRSGAITFMYLFHYNVERFNKMVGWDIRNNHWNFDATDISAGSVRWNDIVWGRMEWRDDGSIWVASSRPLYNEYATTRDDMARAHGLVTVQNEIRFLVGQPGISGPAARVPGPFHRRLTGSPNPIAKFSTMTGYDGYLGKTLTLGFFGNTDPISGGYAVVNPDGRSMNRDWINLVGVAESPEDFPDQREYFAAGIECLELVPIDASGAVVGVEDDTLGDGGATSDWRGLPWGGRGTAALRSQRPAALRCTYLVHMLEANVMDDGDVDGDSDFDEPLVDAIRTAVFADAGLADMQARRRAFVALLAEWGYHADIVDHLVELP